MARSRTVLLALLAALALSLLAAPAQALGQRCETSSSVKRCVELEGSLDDILGRAEVDALRPRVRVKVVSVALQYRTDDGWVGVTRHEPSNKGFFGGHATGTLVACGSVARGVFRTRAVVAWRVRGEDRTHTDDVVSRGVRKSRLCD